MTGVQTCALPISIPLPRLLGIPSIWGTAGLTASAGVAGWVETLMLRRTLNARIGRTGLDAGFVMKLWASALTGAAVAWAVKLALPNLHPVVGAMLILGPYGAVYFGVTTLLRVPEGMTVVRRLPGLGSRKF